LLIESLVFPSTVEIEPDIDVVTTLANDEEEEEEEEGEGRGGDEGRLDPLMLLGFSVEGGGGTSLATKTSPSFGETASSSTSSFTSLERKRGNDIKG